MYYKNIFTNEEYLNTYVVNQFKGDDDNYVTDWNKLRNLGLHNPGYRFYLASRYADCDEDNNGVSSFGIRVVSFSSVNKQYLWMVNSVENGAGTYNSELGLRPVFLIKSNVIISGGSGTSSDPYTLSFE